MRKIIMLFLVGWGVFMGSNVLPADDQRTITLNVSVTNPSLEQTKEMDFKAELPGELKRPDIISSDGLNVIYDAESMVFTVQRKVTLQPGETTYYRIITRDVWLVPEEAFAELEAGAKRLKSKEQRNSILEILNKIRARQKQEASDVHDHIATYRENRKELESIRKELAAEQSAGGYNVAMNNSGLLLGMIILGALVAAPVFFLMVKSVKIPRRAPGNFLKLPGDIRTECILLPQGNVMPSPRRSKIKERGISILSTQRYPDHAALEMKVFLPGNQSAFVFTGFVVQQASFTAEDRECFEVFISLVEASENSYEILNQYVQTHLKD